MTRFIEYPNDSYFVNFLVGQVLSRGNKKNIMLIFTSLKKQYRKINNCSFHMSIKKLIPPKNIYNNRDF